MEIKNKTLYDKDLIVKYNNYYVKSYLQKNFIIMSIITLGFMIYMLIIKQWQYALTLLAILLIYLVGTYFMQKSTTSRMLKKSPLVEQPVLQTYEFRDYEYSVINIQTKTSGYESLRKLKSSKEFYVLITKDNRRLIVSKKGFESIEDENRFVELIKGKLKSKK